MRFSLLASTATVLSVLGHQAQAVTMTIANSTTTVHTTLYLGTGTAPYPSAGTGLSSAPGNTTFVSATLVPASTITSSAVVAVGTTSVQTVAGTSKTAAPTASAAAAAQGHRALAVSGGALGALGIVGAIMLGL